jgi:hypothetical protein
VTKISLSKRENSCLSQDTPAKLLRLSWVTGLCVSYLVKVFTVLDVPNLETMLISKPNEVYKLVLDKTKR